MTDAYQTELRRACLTEAHARKAYAEGRLDAAGLQRELRRAAGQRERAERMVLVLVEQMCFVDVGDETEAV